MNQRMMTNIGLLVALAILLPGCTAQRIRLTDSLRPARAPQLDAYKVFVGSWKWEAEVLNAVEGEKAWSGTAEWEWALDDRCLHGRMSAKSNSAQFDSAGIWSWHPKNKKYMWWIFNNWGYPQQGTATYNEATQTWRMTYTSIGLDGTTSYGLYELTVVDNDTLDWTMTEWADGWHAVKKIEMIGTYKRIDS